MRFPVELTLQPSSTIMASVLVAHLAAALALFHVDAFLPRGGGVEQWLFAVFGWGVLLASLVRGLRAQHLLRDCTMWLEADGTLEFIAAQGHAGGLFRVLPGSPVVLANAVWFVALALAPTESNQATRRLRLMLVPDNLVGAGFRPLRAWLSHRAGRTSDATEAV